MPFKSDNQRKWMFKNLPRMAEKWANEEKRKQATRTKVAQIRRPRK